MHGVSKSIFELFKNPVYLTFLASTLLSLIAIFGAVTIGKDGAFYIDIAQSVSSDGWFSAFEKFNWPWYSILIAIIHDLIKVDHEVVAYALTVLFMAGTCSLVVSMVKRKAPEAAYWAVLLVLSIPVFNDFRAEIIRETGFWFFIILSVWLVNRNNSNTFLNGFFIQVSIILAALFRVEALFIVPAVFFYLVFDGKVPALRNRVLNIFKVFSIYFLFSFLLIFVLLFTELDGGVFSQKRIANVLELINPYHIYESFLFVSDKFAQAVLLKWSHSDAPVIVFFGFLAALIFRIISYAGIFSFILFDSVGRAGLIQGCKKYKLNIIAIGLYFCILLIFFFQVRFVNSRYSSLLLILSVPILAVALNEVKYKWPRLIKVFIFVSVLVMFANVISISTKKSHYLEAAQWVKENTSKLDSIYYEDSRIAYYAGRGYPHMPDLNQVLERKKTEAFSYFIIESDVDDKDFLIWVDESGLKVVSEKTNGKKSMYILEREKSSP